MVHYKLLYFNYRARAEPARLILACAGVPWEDVRFTSPEWNEMKSEFPFQQCPVLKVDGKILWQTMSIGRYLARAHGLAGKDEWEAAKCDVLVEGIWCDYFPQFADWWFSRKRQQPDMDSRWKDLTEVKQPLYLERYEKLLKENGTGYFVGNDVTWADLVIAEWCYTIQETNEILEKFPALQAHMKTIQEIPNIKKWIESRPISEF